MSPQALARLPAARDGARRAAPASGGARAWRWLTATALAAVLAVGVGLQFLPQAPTSSAPGVTTPAPPGRLNT